MARPDPPPDGLAAGDPAALAAAYDAHAASLFALARRLLPVQADAEECVQEVFVKLVEAGSRLSAIENLRAYLCASVRHAAAACSRRRERAALLHERAAPVDEALTPSPARGEARELGRALERLPPEQREVVALKVDGELTFAEIASVLGISLNTAASRYRYALARLKAALQEEP